MNAPDSLRTGSAERGRWTFVATCAMAGGLSVRPDPLGTLLAAAGAALLGMLGLRVWHWSRLPSFMRKHGDQDDRWQLLQPLRWLVLGLVVGLTLLAIIRLVIEPAVPSMGARIAAAGALPVWRRLVIIFVAAVIEELVFRLLLFSATVGLAIHLLRRSTFVPTPGIVWSANVISALAFAAVHLPAWSGASTSPALMLSVLALNAAAGLVIGYVFATRGIVAAIWTHAGGDCAIQLVGTLST